MSLLPVKECTHKNQHIWEAIWSLYQWQNNWERNYGRKWVFTIKVQMVEQEERNMGNGGVGLVYTWGFVPLTPPVQNQCIWWRQISPWWQQEDCTATLQQYMCSTETCWWKKPIVLPPSLAFPWPPIPPSPRNINACWKSYKSLLKALFSVNVWG